MKRNSIFAYLFFKRINQNRVALNIKSQIIKFLQYEIYFTCDKMHHTAMFHRTWDLKDDSDYLSLENQSSRIQFSTWWLHHTNTKQARNDCSTITNLNKDFPEILNTSWETLQITTRMNELKNILNIIYGRGILRLIIVFKLS